MKELILIIKDPETGEIFEDGYMYVPRSLDVKTVVIEAINEAIDEHALLSPHQ
jgi:hypothetical protein